MITCVNDLIGTYIDKSDKELFAAWVKITGSLMKEQGKCIEWFVNKFCSVEIHGGTIILNSIGSQWLSDKRELTIKDFKPIRTEYVKVTDSIFDLKLDFKKNELYEKVNGYHELNFEGDLVSAWSEGRVYRKVEREITWQDEVLCDFALWSEGGKVGMNGNFSEENFIEMCHKVYHLTK